MLPKGQLSLEVSILWLHDHPRPLGDLNEKTKKSIFLGFRPSHVDGHGGHKMDTSGLLLFSPLEEVKVFQVCNLRQKKRFFFEVFHF